MRVIANGTAYDVTAGTTVAAFIRDRGLDPRRVIVELRGEALPRAVYETTVLADGDRLEVVRAVAGGAGRVDGGPRRERLARARLYVVTGAPAERGDLESFLESVLAGGADIVQLREKEAEAGHLLRLARVFRQAARAHDALFVLNDRPDVALAAGADGVHLGQNDLPAAVARRILGPDALIGVSTRTPEQLAGLEYVRHVAARADRPWFAIGGIDPGNVAEVVVAGATRAVVVRAVTEAADPAAAARVLRAALEGAPTRR